MELEDRHGEGETAKVEVLCGRDSEEMEDRLLDKADWFFATLYGVLSIISITATLLAI